jgi:CubicO group peptidase (beta-lactamase class C family)
MVRIGALALGLAAAVRFAAAGELPVAKSLVPLPAQPAGIPFPTDAWPEAEPGADVDRAALERALDHAFATSGRGGLKNTRALLVVHRGALVTERYAPGFDPATRFHSWSMAKSVTQALVGILVREGRLDVLAPAPVPAWREPGDPRGVLTLNHLLHMTTGLQNSDGHGGEGPDSFMARLIFGTEAVDQAAFASSVPLAEKPDTHWAYSTGTSTILAWIAQRSAGGTRDALLAFMRRELFEPLGITSGVPEFDAAGTFMGGGFFWADARDWARFGYLYLRDGVWEGRRILPEGWVDYTRTPAPAPNNSTHTAHFWVNADPKEGQFGLLPRGSPESIFCASGAYGQWVCMVPTHDLLIVRLGEMHGLTWDQVKRPLGKVIDAFPPLDGRSQE